MVAFGAQPRLIRMATMMNGATATPTVPNELGEMYVEIGNNTVENINIQIPKLSWYDIAYEGACW